jgi:NAD(P)-dependent dehydrogenase (short-subunit alcohol dehydrogenase family)
LHFVEQLAVLRMASADYPFQQPRAKTGEFSFSETLYKWVATVSHKLGADVPARTARHEPKRPSFDLSHLIGMDLQVAGKLALITGSTGGIGFAIAEALSREGADVIVNGRTQARVDEALTKLKAANDGVGCHGLAADLGTEQGVQAAIQRWPDIDILINNLGIFEPKKFEEICDLDWLRFFEVNVLSGVRLSRHYLPRMKQKNWGRIVFISSESALQIPVEMIHYGMTKTAQLAIARGLAETTTGTNVTVNAVLPGPTASEGVVNFVDKLAGDQKKSRQEVERDFFEHARPTSIIKRFERPDEIAAVVAFIASPHSSAINGATVRADGGVVRSIA